MRARYMLGRVDERQRSKAMASMRGWAASALQFRGLRESRGGRRSGDVYAPGAKHIVRRVVLPRLLAQLFEPLNKLRDIGRLNQVASIRECLQQFIRKLKATEPRHPLRKVRHVSLACVTNDVTRAELTWSCALEASA